VCVRVRCALVISRLLETRKRRRFKLRLRGGTFASLADSEQAIVECASEKATWVAQKECADRVSVCMMP